MRRLSRNTLAVLRRAYRQACGLRADVLGLDGGLPEEAPHAALRNNALFRRSRAHALGEAVRWGEPYVYFAAPGLLTWVVPMLDGVALAGGLTGGEVRLEGVAADTREAVNFMVSAGVSRRAAQDWIGRRPVWPRERVRTAAAELLETFYQVSGWDASVLTRHRDNAAQQRQIAEEIQAHKSDRNAVDYPLDEERLLLSMIRVGDRQGALRVLNTMLAAIFLRSPRLAVIRARVIELMGYLVRAAVEDSPLLDPLLARQHHWMERVLATESFDALCIVTRDGLDDFINSIFTRGFGLGSPQVARVLDYLERHFAETIRLDDVAAAAGLSTYRVAHVVKTNTGRSVMQHLRRLRIEKARRLLETTTLSCAEIAQETGFCDQSALTRRFREMTGMTPARYRRERRRPASGQAVAHGAPGGRHDVQAAEPPRQGAG